MLFDAHQPNATNAGSILGITSNLVFSQWERQSSPTQWLTGSGCIDRVVHHVGHPGDSNVPSYRTRSAAGSSAVRNRGVTRQESD